jgi:hypothetical protein
VIAGIFGIAGAANFPAAGPPLAPSASVDGAINFSREMICVYGLGPAGACGIWEAGWFAAGFMKAPVAPSPGRELDLADGFSFATLGLGAIGLGGIGMSGGAIGGSGAT